MHIRITDNQDTAIAKRWLVLAVVALAAAGIFSLPPVILRGPYFAQLFDVQRIFDLSLIVHVNLSVIFWFFSMGSTLWSLSFKAPITKYAHYPFWLTAVAMGLMIMSVFMPSSMAIKNNYIPVIIHPLFFISLILLAIAVLMQCLFTIDSNIRSGIHANSFTFLSTVSAIAMLITLIAYLLSFFDMPLDHSYHDGLAYFEMLFWAGGHLMQFAFALIVVSAWLILAKDSGIRHSFADEWLNGAAYSYLAIIVLGMAIGFMTTRVGGGEDIQYFMQLKRYFVGTLPIVAMGAIVVAFIRGHQEQEATTIQHEHRPCSRTFLLLSFVLFTLGGCLSLIINGANAIIPAHYHGSIVGITTALMGLCWFLMPTLGFVSPQGRLARLQPWIYAGGQCLHISGLALMGGYGALRKEALSSDKIDTTLGKAMFFSGGSLAILGGVLFVIITVQFMCKKKNQTI